jgi:acyl-coenzyme A thioesterase PaaI-like protein
MSPDQILDPEEPMSSIRAIAIATEPNGDSGLIATLVALPEVRIADSGLVRPSMLATLADVAAGTFANATTQPRICVTLDLDIHLTRDPVGRGFEDGAHITCRSSVAKSGRQITVMAVELFDGEGRNFGFGHGGFIASPNPAHEYPGGFPLRMHNPVRLSRPIEQQTGVRRLGGGRAVMPGHPRNGNATGAIQGGLVALAAEEAILDLDPTAVISSLTIRYLHAFRGSNAVAAASIDNGVAMVAVSDEARGRLGTTVVAHLRQ